MNSSLTRYTIALAVLAALPLSSGCSHEEVAPTGVTNTTSIPLTALPAASPGKPGSSVYLSDRLRSECGITTIASVKDAPKFAFDESSILPEDRDVLAEVAKCLTEGPLKGHSIWLVGRADPRGEAQYNMALGERRSNAVSNYLSGLGVPASRLSDTSRGALDATGNDEATWRLDRRVDIDVAK